MQANFKANLTLVELNQTREMRRKEKEVGNLKRC